MDKISVFMDGEASRRETRQTMMQLKQSGECCETWETFHLIGDAMRGDHPALYEDFHARLHASLEHEPALSTPRITWQKSGNLVLSVAASCTALAVVLSLVITDNPLKPQDQVAATPPQPEIVQVSQTPLPPPATPQPVPAANQARVNEYLMAHQEYSPSTAFQGVVPYVRTVSATQDGSAR